MRVGPKKRFKTPFRDDIWNRRQVSGAIGGSFPHDPETVGDRAPIVLLLISARIAIVVGIMWCYIYDARPSQMVHYYRTCMLRGPSQTPLIRLANHHTSVRQDYETSDHRNIVVHDNYRTRYSVVQHL